MTAPAIATAKEAVELLERVVSKAGEDFIYPRAIASKTECVYVEAGAPSCIIGHALALAGYEIEEISRLDLAEEGVVSASGIPLRGGFFRVTPEAASVFQMAQLAQDRGDSWGTALDEARERAAFYAPHDAAGANA